MQTAQACLTCPDQTYSITYDKPWLTEAVAGEETNDQPVVLCALGDSSALSNDKTSDVICNLGFTSIIIIAPSSY